MAKDMKDSGLIMKNMALENIDGQMDVFIVVVTRTEKEMERVKWSIKMKNNIREIGLMDKNMGGVSIARELSSLWGNGVAVS